MTGGKGVESKEEANLFLHFDDRFGYPQSCKLSTEWWSAEGAG